MIFMLAATMTIAMIVATVMGLLEDLRHPVEETVISRHPFRPLGR